jgi:hypothetical protein
MEGIIAIIVQLVIGAVGGNAVGSAAKNLSLGTAGNSIVGAIGGVVLSQILAAMGIAAPGGQMPDMGAAAGGGGLDVGALIAQVIGSGAGGAILTAVVGAIKNAMGK